MFYALSDIVDFYNNLFFSVFVNMLTLINSLHHLFNGWMYSSFNCILPCCIQITTHRFVNDSNMNTINDDRFDISHFLY